MKGKSKSTISSIDNNEYCITNGQFTKHIIKNGLTLEEYVKKYILNDEDITCPICNIRNKKIDKPTWKFFDYCKSRECGSIVLSHKIKNDPELHHRYKTNMQKILSDKNSPTFLKWKEAIYSGNMKQDENGLTGYQRTAIR